MVYAPKLDTYIVVLAPVPNFPVENRSHDFMVSLRCSGEVDQRFLIQFGID